MVSKRGLEPLHPFGRQPLKLVRLPISPLRRGVLFPARRNENRAPPPGCDPVLPATSGLPSGIRWCALGTSVPCGLTRTHTALQGMCPVLRRGFAEMFRRSHM
jgi:hypothetical protein